MDDYEYNDRHVRVDCDEVISPTKMTLLIIGTVLTCAFLFVGYVRMIPQLMDNVNVNGTAAGTQQAMERSVGENDRGMLMELGIGIWGLLVGCWMLIMGE